jgi:hypothetical protein
VRFLVDAERGQARPAASWTAFTIAHILHTMETPRLAWDFVAPFRSAGVEPVFAYIDYHRVPEAEFTAAGTRHAVFAHDWRRLGWDAFLEMMGERELDEGSGVVAPPPFAGRRPPVLSQPEFADAVRAALRDRHRPDRLEGNPLARSRVLHDRYGDGAAGPEALARLLDETAATLAADPRDAKAHRAVDRTYLHPAPTQERAAELLDLPFSTYRRHLARGIERITSQLWDLELSASGGGQGSGTDRSGR